MRFYKTTLFAISAVFIAITATAQTKKLKDQTNNTTMTTNNKKMTVEIWSDVMCPFCYLGKQKFDNALNHFKNKDKVEVVWKSFQLNPYLKTDTNITIHEYLAREKGFSMDRAKSLNNQVAEMGKEVGLTYNFDKMIVANTFNAHRFLHYAKDQGKQNEAEDRMFKAFFTEGKNIDDTETLLALGAELGFNKDSLSAVLANGTYTKEVNADITEAQQLGIRGVPFFVFNRKYAVSGAQDSKVFLETLEKAFEEWKKDNPGAFLQIIDGKVCDVNGKCE
ncbi:MAG TPA: DsbA family oxidoreductase [Cytophagaceae bacterium]